MGEILINPAAAESTHATLTQLGARATQLTTDILTDYKTVAGDGAGATVESGVAYGAKVQNLGNKITESINMVRSVMGNTVDTGISIDNQTSGLLA